MMRFLRNLSPRRISGQILILVLFSAAITQIVNIGISTAFMASKQDENRLRNNLGTFIVAVPLIAATTDMQARTRLISALNHQTPNLELRLTNATDSIPVLEEFQSRLPPPNLLPPPLFGGGKPSAKIFLAMQLGPGYKLALEPIPNEKNAGGLQRVFAALPDGTVLTARLPHDPMPGPPNGYFSTLTILLVILLPVALIWAARALSRQLRDFARAAEDFSFEGTHAPLPETGPDEIRIAAQAFNRMRERLADLVKDRTQMLSAVGHDLRTPVTRIRLRAEFIEDAETRTAMMRDIERMDAMIDAALTFLRDGHKSDATTKINLDSLLRTVCAEFTDVGDEVHYEGISHITVSADPEALARAIENLIQNALRHGETVRLRLGVNNDDLATIDIDDDGPGIAAADRAAMLEPFVRGDKARSATDGGFGLGLAIAFSIARSLGGSIALMDSDLGGLRARITLPQI